MSETNTQALRCHTSVVDKKKDKKVSYKSFFKVLLGAFFKKYH